MPESKLDTCSILADRNPPILLSHSVLDVVYAVKVYGEHGKYHKIII
jgi:hypothetical protein